MLEKMLVDMYSLLVSASILSREYCALVSIFTSSIVPRGHPRRTTLPHSVIIQSHAPCFLTSFTSAHSSFSFTDGPWLPGVDVLPTASGPPIALNTVWNTYSVACSIGASNMKGKAGTAARPSFITLLVHRPRPHLAWKTYSYRTPSPQLRIRRVLQRAPAVSHNTMNSKSR